MLKRATSTGLRDVIVFSRGAHAGAGGLEMFNRNMIAQLEKRTTVSAPVGGGGRLRDYAGRLVATFRELRARGDADVIVQYGSFLDVLCLPLLRLMSGRISIIAHVSDPWVHIRLWPLYWVTMLALRLCARHVFVLSEQQLKVFAPARPRKIHTIIGPAFEQIPRTVVGRSGFLFLGRVVKEKGIFDLIEAWADPRIAGRGLQLRVVGSVSEADTAALNEHIAMLDLTGLVTLAGPVRGDEAVIAAVDGAEAVLYPSYADAFPLVMIESFARGTPCLVSTVGEGSSFVDNPSLVVTAGDVGAIADAIVALAAGQIGGGYLDAMRAKARQYARGEIVADLAAAGAITLGKTP